MKHPHDRQLTNKDRLVISEAHVQQSVVQFLELDGWRAIRTDPVSDRSRGKGFGEQGMADYLFLRYFGRTPRDFQTDLPNWPRVEAEVLWIEFKRKGKSAKAHQQAWIVAEAQRGALVLVVDDIDEFTSWYKASGLCRRIL